MKKRFLGFLLAGAMICSILPTTSAADLAEPTNGFMLTVAEELPEKQRSGLMDDVVDLPDVNSKQFIGETSGDMPEIRADGFLTKPSQPLKEFPAPGSLLSSVSTPDENATKVSTAEELAAMTTGGNYVLTQDIDLSGVVWTAIASASNIILDGQGHTISGMNCTVNIDCAALFRNLSDSTVRNVIFASPVFESAYTKATAGTIAANASGNLTIENCSVENATVTNGNTFGGFVGAYSDKSGTLDISDCAVSFSTPEEMSVYTMFGGLVGTVVANEVKFTDCLVQMSSASESAGLAYKVQTTAICSMLRCAVDGKMSDGQSAGMVYELKGACQATDCAFDGTLENGKAGFIQMVSGAGVFQNCRASGTIYNGQSSFVGQASGDLSFYNCLADMDNTVTKSAGYYVGSLLGRGEGSFYAENCLNTGNFEQTEDASIYIGGLLGYINSPAVAQFLRCENQGDIDAKFYTGGMVAGGKTTTESFHLIDCVNTGTLSSVTVGGLVAHGNAIARNCVNTGALQGTTVGGMVAKSYASNFFTDCRSNTTITLDQVATCYGGGMIGQMTAGEDSEYDGCATNITFVLPEDGSAMTLYAGGLAAEGSGDVDGCVSKVRFEGTNLLAGNLSGLIGSATDDVTITNSIADIEVEEITFQKATALGGLVGMASDSITVDNCATTINMQLLTQTPGYVGGMVGFCYGTTLIYRSYSIGSIDMCPEFCGSAQGYAGGLIGKLDNYYSSAFYHSSHLMEIKGCWADVNIYDASYMGGLVGYCDTLHATVSSSWADGTLSLENAFALPSDDIIIAECMGGLVGRNLGYDAMLTYNRSLYMQDCYFDGALEYANAKFVGGLVGEGAQLVHNCYSTADVISVEKEIDGSLGREPNVGGLVGMCTEHYTDFLNDTTPGIVSYSYYGGKIVTFVDYVGGIVGQGYASNCLSTANVQGITAGGIVGRGYAFDCQFDGLVHGCSYAGGITGNGYAEGCTSSGTVKGRRIGGIVGGANYYYFSGKVSDCTSDCLLYPCGDWVSTSYYIGGIVGGGGDVQITDCHYERVMLVDTNHLSALTVGGIVGEGATLCSNCSSKGVVVNDLHISQFIVGGISGQYLDGNIENCRVDGAVQTIGQAAAVYAGGLVGYTDHNVGVVNCIVNGDVITSIEPLVEGGTPTVDCGTLVGHCLNRTVTIENCQHNGRFSQGKQYYGDNDYWANLPEVGDGRKKYASVPSIMTPERPVEDYQVTVKALQTNGTWIPLAGATVYANDTCVGTSNENGELRFDSELFAANTPVRLSASAEGYFDAVANTFLADGGAFTLVLKEKAPGEIYFRSATMIGAETGVSDLLSGVTGLRIPLLDENSYPLTVEVDWNDLDETPRSLMLTNESYTHMIGLNSEGGTTYVTLPSTFDVGEEIYLRAVGTKDGEAITKMEKLSVQVQNTDVHFPTEAGNMDVGGNGDKNNLDYLYFVKGLGINLDFDDLEDFASSISYKNGSVTVKFSTQDKQKKTISVWEGFSEKVSVGGKVTVPVSNLSTGEWSGEINVSVNDGVKTDISNTTARKYNEKAEAKDKITYDFLIGGVPCFLETSLDVGGSASFGVHGPYDDAYVNGDVTIKGGGGIFAGLGGEVVKDVEFKIGGEGEIDVTLPMEFDTADENVFSLNPELTGDLNVKVSVKAYILELEEKLRLGGFHWDKDGAVWTWFDEEPAAFSRLAFSNASSMQNSNWNAMDRDYLTAGGGFLTQDVSGYAFNSAANQSLRYENIGALTETTMAVTSDNKVILYYTADDGVGTDGDMTTHAVLYSTVQLEDGSWSDPVAVSSTADGYPASPDASGDYVIWVESTEVDSLDDMLASTRIRIAKNDGTIVHTIDTDGYVYAPKISAYGENVLVCWMSDSSVSSTNLMGGETELYSAFCASGVWGETKKVSTVGIPLVASPVCSSSESYSSVFYVNDQGEYRQGGRTTVYQSNLDTGRTVMEAGIVAVFGEDNTLTIYNRDWSTDTKTVDYNGTVTPDMYFNPNSYTIALAWPEDNGIYVTTNNDGGFTWEEPYLLTNTSGSGSELSAAIVGDEPTIAYTQDVGDYTHLYTAKADPDAVDLVLVDVEYEEQEMLERGFILFQGTVYNNGLSKVNQFTLTVVDENDTQIYTRTYSTEIGHGETAAFSAAIGHDGLDTHTYRFWIEPVSKEDADDTDNGLDVVVGVPNAQIVDANFQEVSDGSVQLCAMVQNTGVVQLDGLTVEITAEDGEILLSQTYQEEEAIPYASIRQLLLDDTQANTYYRVSVLYQGETLDTTILMYEDPDAQVLTATSVRVDGKDAQVTIYGQNQSASTSGMIMLGIYSDGQMVAVGTEQVSTLNGSTNLQMTLSDSLSVGRYEYKVFFLSDDGQYIPVASEVSGTIQV